MALSNNTLQAVVLMVCDKHAPHLLEKLHACPDGNWFVMPPIANCRTGYHPNVSAAHSAPGCAVFGFAEHLALAQRLREFASLNPDGSLCPDCMAYEWDVMPRPLGHSGRDPVCGRTVSGVTSLWHHHDGELFGFCGIRCRDAFIQAPHDYLSPRPEVHEQPSSVKVEEGATLAH